MNKKQLQKDLKALVEVSRFYGANPDTVLAGGGNTSLKTDDALYIKPSGTELATIEADDFVALDRERVRATLEARYSDDPMRREAEVKNDLLAARLPLQTGRPSVETALHEQFQGRFVVHIHPWLANTLGCARQGRRAAQSLFGERLLWIPYCDPGYTLAKAVQKNLAEYRKAHDGADPEITLIQNHGPFFAGDSVAVVRRTIARFFKDIEAHLAKNDKDPFRGAARRDLADCERPGFIAELAPALRGMLGQGRRLPILRFDDSPLVRDFTSTPEGARCVKGGPLTPDQIVYCKCKPLWVARGADAQATADRAEKALARYREQWQDNPRVVAVEGVGIFTVGDTVGAASNVRDVYVDALRIMRGAYAAGGVHAMTPRQYGFIDNWEVENYRRQVAAKASGAGRVAGKVAFVTGAAQGFGLEIAEHMAGQGACVVLGDLNIDGAREAAERIAERWGPGSAMAVSVNVADADSVAAAAQAVARAYGGLDVLVSNAGVLRAESVKTQPEKDFDFTTSVNYRGYFLCVKYFCPLMAAQHARNAEARADIVQVNSKSGLEGSNRNFAYAGSKFGGIGLTQSFALELVSDGIKVNSVCPGNFLDGPLWSDPKRGLFVQYLRTGKVPGAKTLADVRRAYENKVPMKRGCTTDDVMHAIYYLIDQQYETGQAVPVTGGQIMLK